MTSEFLNFSKYVVYHAILNIIWNYLNFFILVTIIVKCFQEVIQADLKFINKHLSEIAFSHLHIYSPLNFIVHQSKVDAADFLYCANVEMEKEEVPMKFPWSGKTVGFEMGLIWPQSLHT